MLSGKRFSSAAASALFLFIAILAAVPSAGQEARRSAFRAVNYEVNATLAPAEHTLTARARVEFEPLTSSPTVEVELNPNLRVTSVQSEGKSLTHTRGESPLTVQVSLPQPATPGKRITLTFEYSGTLDYNPDPSSRALPLAYIGTEGSYLLLPSRWFPLTSYPGNRYTSTFSIAVPNNVAVVGTGRAAAPVPESPAPIASGQAPVAPAAQPAKAGVAPPAKAAAAPAARIAAEPGPAPTPRTVYTFRSDRPEPGGTFVAGNLQFAPVRIEGLNLSVFTRPAQAATAAATGETVAKIVNFFSEQFAPLQNPHLTIAQLPDGTLAGYAAPGLLLVSQRQWEGKSTYRLLARLAAKQWWENEVLPAAANDVWLSDGLARYSEGLYVEHAAGQEGLNTALEDFAVGALTYEDAAPIAQVARLEAYSGEYNSVVINKGAMVFHMLRGALGDEPFHALLRAYFQKFAGKPARLADFEALATEAAASRAASENKQAPHMRSFFSQWLSSTGVPEFKLEYVVLRTKKGFKVVGKVRQDLETFRMTLGVRVETEGNPEFKSIEIAGTESDFVIETFGRPKPQGISFYPANQLLKSSPQRRVRMFIARGEESAEAGRYYEAVQDYQRALEVQKNNSLAHFRLGEAMFYQRNYNAAANAFRDAIEGDLDISYKWVEVWSRIYLGKIFDVGGQRERAVNEYSKAKQLNDDTGGAQAEADRYLKDPFTDEPKKGSG